VSILGKDFQKRRESVHGGSRKNILFLRVLKILTEDRHCVVPLFKAAPPAESILR
jgi:hypothetical protein